MVLFCGFKTSFQTSSGFNMVNSKDTNELFKILMASSRLIRIQFFIFSSYILRKKLYGRSRSLAITNPNANINNLS